jgi:outer membrane receptor protein involved in Fe transport
MTYEAGVKLDLPAVSGSLTYYHSDLTDAIERTSGSFLGLPCFDKNDNGACDPGEPPILQKANIGESRITGTELDFRVPLSETVALLGNHVWTEGENLTADEPMSRIPPAYGALIVRWQRSGDLVPWAELVYQFAGAQRDICAADAADTRIGPDGTDGFSVFHVRGGLTLGRHFRFTAALENILDETYKYHASSFYRPGRQLVLGAELKL